MSKQLLQPPRGTYDALPEQAARLRYIENTALQVLGRYGFGEIRTPVFEFTDLFARNVGNSTDIVNKEMYVFDDKGGESMALRPEGTAPCVRAYYTHKLKHSLPLKLAYVGTPMFRYERPQKGRFRQFHQIGCEVFGPVGPMADVEVIAAGVAMMQALNIGGDDIIVRLNSLGTKEDRASYRALLVNYFTPYVDKLSAESRVRLEDNPLRILDSKAEADQALVKNAPMPLDSLSEASNTHFEAVKNGLTTLGIAWELAPTLVRGLDYYTHTVFEIHGVGLGAQSQVIGGGRYDGLFKQIGGEDIAAVGWGCGLERLDMLMPELPETERPVVFVVQDEKAHTQALQLAEVLRSEGFSVQLPLDLNSMKAQFKRADKLNARLTIIIGENELNAGAVTVKDMDNGVQEAVTPDAFVDYVSGLVRNLT